MKLISYILGFLTAIILVLSLTTGSVFAQDTSQIKQIQVSIDNLSANNGSLTGKLTITNPTSLLYPQVFYTMNLSFPDTTSILKANGQNIPMISNGMLVNYLDSQYFSLEPNQTITQTISFPYPVSLPDNTYKFFWYLSDKNSKLLATYEQAIPLKGTGEYLQINDCKLITGGITYSPNVGPNVAPNGEIQGVCNVTNPSSKSISVYPESIYAINHVAGYNESEQKKFSEKILTTIGPRETKDIIIPLPKLTTPQVYESQTVLKDTNNTIVSAQAAFRWIIAGESAVIQSVTLDKSSYEKGQTAAVKVVADPSVDLYWKDGGLAIMGASGSSSMVHPTLQGTPLKKPTLSITIQDGNGKVCGEKTQPIKGKNTSNLWEEQFISISINTTCNNAKVSAQIKNDEKPLAKKDIEVAYDTNTPSENKVMQIIAGAIITIILLAVGFLWYRKRKMKNPPTTMQPPQNTTIKVLLLLVLVYSIYSIINVLSHSSSLSSQSIPIVYADNDNSNGDQDQQPTPTTRPNRGNGTLEVQPPGTIKVEAGTVTYRGTPWSNDDEVAFDLNDTNASIAFNGTAITAPVTGRLYGRGCINTQGGLFVRVYVDGKTTGFLVNGQPLNKLVIGNTYHIIQPIPPINELVSITPSFGSFTCGEHTVKIEVIPAIWHYGVVASDPAEDIHDAFVQGFANRYNCDGTGPCWGVLQKTLNITTSCTTPTPAPPTPTPTPLACGAPCTTPANCVGAINGCTYCLPNTAGQRVCSPARACNEPCDTPADCQGAQGCGSCLADGTGKKTCQPPPACGSACSDDTKCIGAPNGCTSCVPNDAGQKVCAPAPACGTSCLRDDQCAAAKDGCTSCLDNDTGGGKSCKPTPACGTACTKDSQCAGAKNGCTNCTAGKCSAFREDMCKCDGMDFQVANGANTFFPGDKVTFIAFGKVEGTDINFADLQSMTFSLYQSKLSDPNSATRIAQSTAITPQIVQNDPQKVRYKVSWDHQIPSSVPAGTLFRVQATIKCVAKPGVLGAKTVAIPGQTNYFMQLYDVVSGLFAKGSVLGDTTRNDQHADTFFPGAKIQEKSCTLIKFYFE